MSKALSKDFEEATKGVEATFRSQQLSSKMSSRWGPSQKARWHPWYLVLPQSPNPSIHQNVSLESSAEDITNWLALSSNLNYHHLSARYHATFDSWLTQTEDSMILFLYLLKLPPPFKTASHFLSLVEWRQDSKWSGSFPQLTSCKVPVCPLYFIHLSFIFVV